MQETNSSDIPEDHKSAADDGADNPSSEEQERAEGASSLSFGQMFASTLWAALGVQKKSNRERDFTRGKATHFIFFGIGFTVIFVLAMYTLVRFVLGGTG